VLLEKAVNAQLLANEMKNALRVRNCFSFQARQNVTGKKIRCHSGQVFVEEWKQPVGISDRDQIIPVNRRAGERSQLSAICVAACDAEEQVVFEKVSHGYMDCACSFEIDKGAPNRVDWRKLHFVCPRELTTVSQRHA